MGRELTGRITLKDNYTATMEKVAKLTQKSASSSTALQKAQKNLDKAMKGQEATSQMAVKAAEKEAAARARAENAAQRVANSKKQLAAAEKMQQAALADAEGKKGKAAEAALNRANKAGLAATAAAEQVTRWEGEYERLSASADQAGEKAAAAADKAASATKNAENQVRGLQQQMKRELSPRVKAEAALKKLKPISDTYKGITKKAWGIVVAAKDKAQGVIKPILNAQKQLITKAWDITLKVKNAAGSVLKKTGDTLKKLAKGIIIPLGVAGAGATALGIGMVKGGMELENYEVSMQHFIERTGGAGGDTKAVQQALQAAGLYKGAIDGIAGKQTKAALLAYQKANGLDKTGTMDPATMAKLLPNGGANNAQAATENFMTWLREYAAKTQYGSDEAIAAGTRAVSIAEGDTASAQALVALAGDMAALTPGKTIMDAMEALADAQMGEMERLKEFGFKGDKKALDAAGGDMFKMKNAAGMDLTQIFGGGAEKLGQTSSGMWSTVTGTAQSAMQEAGREMLEGLKPGIAALIPMVDQLTPHFQSFGRSAGAAIGRVIKWAISAKERISEWVNNNRPLIEGIKSAVRNFGTAAGTWLGRAVTKVGDIMSSISDWVANNQPLINDIRRALQNFGSRAAARIGDVITKVGEIKDGIAKWVSNNKPLIDEIRRKISLFVTTANDKINGFVSMIDQNMPMIKAAIGGALEAAGNVLQWLWDLWQAAWPNIVGFVQAAADYMPTAFKVIRAVFQGIGEALSWLGDFFGAVWPYITSVVSWAVDFIAGAANWIIDHWNVIGPLVMGVAIAFGVLGGIVLALKTYVAICTAAQWLFNAAMAVNPIIWIILAVGLLIGGLIALAQNWESVRSAMMDGWEAVQHLIDNVLLTMLNTMPDWLVKLFGGDANDLRIKLEEQIAEREGFREGAGAGRSGFREGAGAGRNPAGTGREEQKTAQQAEYAGFDTSEVFTWQKQMSDAMQGMPDKSAFEVNAPTGPTYDPMAEYNKQMALLNGANNPASPVAQASYKPETGAPSKPTLNATAPTIDTGVTDAYAQATQTASDAMAGLTDAASTLSTECPTYMSEVSTATQAAATATTANSQSSAAAMRNSATRMANSMARAASSLVSASGRIRSMASSVVSLMASARSALSNIKVTVNVYGGGAQGPKLASGMDYVPKDEFPAVLHKGEAVLPKGDAEQWRQGKGGGNVMVNCPVQVVRQQGGEADEAFANRVAALIARKVEEAKYNLTPNPA